MSYLIPESNFTTLSEKIEGLNRKAKKLHCAPITLTITDSELIWIADLGIKMNHYHVEVAGEAPIINGWAFVATLEHTTEGALIRTVPGMTAEGELVGYRNADAKCDQCKMNRRRNDTYILKNIETGSFKQVGRNCLQVFLKHTSPEAMASYAELLALAGSSCEGSQDGMGRISGIGTESYLAWVSLAMRTFGWVSSKMAQESFKGVRKTSQAALDMIDDVRKEKYAPRPEDVDRETANKALLWIRDMVIDENTNDYIYNLYIACKADSIPWRQVGIVASLFIAYQNNHGGFEKTEKKVSEYQGKIGEKITITVTVKRVNYCPGFQGGTTTIYGMEDGNENAFTWFSSNDVLKQDTTYTLTAKVKDLTDRYKGIKTTVVNYCKIVKIVDVVAA